MLLSQIDENQLNDNIINKMLFDIPKDDGLKGDCIWVFGSNITQNERVKIAAKLYKEGRLEELENKPSSAYAKRIYRKNP